MLPTSENLVGVTRFELVTSSVSVMMTAPPCGYDAACFEDIEEVGRLSKKKLDLLKEAFNEVGIRRWTRRHSHEGWYIGSNAWEIELIQGTSKVTVEGDDGYDSRLKSLCQSMSALGVPIKFWEGHGLVYRPPRRRKRHK